VTTYAYDHANRLGSFTNPTTSISFGYHGLGDRLQKTMGSEPTYYTLDLAAGLTQVLADDTNTYLYGVGRIVQQGAASTEYLLGDALGHVRQLADAGGNIALAKSYQS